MESIIHQNLYWAGIRESAQKESKNCDNRQRTKRPTENTVNYQLSYMRKHHVINGVKI